METEDVLKLREARKELVKIVNRLKALLLNASEKKEKPDDWRLENGTIEIENATSKKTAQSEKISYI